MAPSHLRPHRVSGVNDSVPAMKKAGRGVHSPGASGSRGPMPLRSTNFARSETRTNPIPVSPLATSPLATAPAVTP
jgi:hypothetical protein